MKKKKLFIVLALISAIFTINISAQNLGIHAGIFIGEINNVKKGLDSDRSDEGFRLSQRTNNDWIKYSISKIARNKWFANMKFFTDFEKAEFNKAFDSLAISAVRELEDYKPNLTVFAFKNPAHEKLLKAKLANSSTLKIHKIGFAAATWQIQTNNYGIPRLRFKRGYIYARDSNDDHNFCHLYYISVNQTYSGGGTFGAAYGNFETDTIVACPK
jgi:hypothetical protein